jgi:3-oxoacyl-[acyl-carrier protein] reductase
VTNNGAYYGVVCNAGFNSDAAFPAMTEGQWDQVVHGNLDGFYNVLQPLIMPMIKLRKGGRVVTMSSVSGLIGNRGQVNYSAAKAGIIGATKALSLELAKRNITVNCVAPGVIATDMTEDLPKEVMDAIPMKRVGSAEEVSAAVSYLCSDAAAYVTRQVIAVNGGLC